MAETSRSAFAHRPDSVIEAHALRIAVVTDRGWIHLRALPEDAAAREGWSAALGSALPQRASTTSGNVAWMSPGEWVIELPLTDRARTLETLAGAAKGRFATVTDLSDGRACIDVTGAHARDLLAKGTPLDLHPRAFAADACARTLLAKATILIRPITGGTGGFRLLVDRSYANYLWEWLADAAAEFVPD